MSRTLRLLQEVVAPVAEVEDREDGREDHPGDDVDLLRPRGELVQPGLQEVVALPLRLYVDLARVELVRGRRRGRRVEHHLVATGAAAAVPAAAHQGLR